MKHKGQGGGGDTRTLVIRPLKKMVSLPLETC